ncbi:hypothetical protein ACFVWY_16745 [Streptomyces sp. NPDC058195]|uniref:hypothetical protein n=1 Tax=Streptomyces sp. NPDC058195 TaxID=3346375 RepID=UPI0036E3E1F0
MSTSDQEQDRTVRGPIAADADVAKAKTEAEAGTDPDAGTEAGAGADAGTEADAGADTDAGTEADADADADADAENDPGAADGAGGRKLTPRQARRLRMVLSALGMAAMAVVLALRIASRSSVLVVGVYGLALILCGIVIELSRNGRTRLGSWLLAVGLVAAIGSDWLLIP